jgi:hypothetical protein
MRTTLNLDDDVVELARALARQEARSLGEVISELVRRGLAPRPTPGQDRNGFPVFHVDRHTPPITDRMVERALDDS